jgi:pimeloyl-ACP methyl ester carboxylesterase
MSTFVIVHGAFGGGWEWTPVADLLRQFGHQVFTPTLTGMGERAHLGTNVGLRTHVDDVVAVLEFEELTSVVLCGASYGGMAVTGAADRVPDRVAQVIYIDALVPSGGQSGLDLLPREFEQVVRRSAADDGLVPVPTAILPPAGIIDERLRAAYVSRLRPQPAATFTEPLDLTGAVETLPRAFLRCTRGVIEMGPDPIAPMAERARAAGWPYRELDTPHDPHLFDPTATAAVLVELTQAVELPGRPAANSDR